MLAACVTSVDKKWDDFCPSFILEWGRVQFPLVHGIFFFLYRIDSGVREYFSLGKRACPLLLVDLESQGLATAVKENKTVTGNTS